MGGEFHRQVFHGQHTSVVQTTLIDLFMTETKTVNTWEELDLVIKQSRLLRKIIENINIFPVKGAFSPAHLSCKIVKSENLTALGQG